MTYAAKLKASRLKPAVAAANPSSTTSDAPNLYRQPSPRSQHIRTVEPKVRGSINMPASIGHGSTDTSRNGPTNVMDSNRLRIANGGVQKSINAPRRRSFHRLGIRIPTAGMRVVKDNYFVQALSHTTYAFCRETTLHGMKYVVQDIEELGSTFSR